MRRALRLLAVTALAASAVLTYSATALGVGGCFAQADAPGTGPGDHVVRQLVQAAPPTTTAPHRGQHGRHQQGGAYAAAERRQLAAARTSAVPIAPASTAMVRRHSDGLAGQFRRSRPPGRSIRARSAATPVSATADAENGSEATALGVNTDPGSPTMTAGVIGGSTGSGNANAQAVNNGEANAAGFNTDTNNNSGNGSAMAADNGEATGVGS